MPEVIYLPAGSEVPFEERTVIIKVHNTPGHLKKTSSKPFWQDIIECHVANVDEWVAVYMNDSWIKIYVVGKAEAVAKQ